MSDVTERQWEQAQDTGQPVTESDAADDERIMEKCPVCSAEQEDFDGFGVVHCPDCGYCIHPNSQDGICGICGI